ncbi:hypothetical protein ADUPG1_009476 [Aduncisulcus paluster]|uniref:Uncharacterized protein n=1 Tax=Aduncisulcus paluster TaxID=2918883 RepID=A0ABQ5KVP9_9EUKA|nr:hypothetical protein ADUPG1_009476 [Aduncisulcus paluster]
MTRLSPPPSFSDIAGEVSFYDEQAEQKEVMEELGKTEQETAVLERIKSLLSFPETFSLEETIDLHHSDKESSETSEPPIKEISEKSSEDITILKSSSLKILPQASSISNPESVSRHESLSDFRGKSSPISRSMSSSSSSMSNPIPAMDLHPTTVPDPSNPYSSKNTKELFHKDVLDSVMTLSQMQEGRFGHLVESSRNAPQCHTPVPTETTASSSIRNLQDLEQPTSLTSSKKALTQNNHVISAERDESPKVSSRPTTVKFSEPKEIYVAHDQPQIMKEEDGYEASTPRAHSEQPQAIPFHEKPQFASKQPSRDTSTVPRTASLSNSHDTTEDGGFWVQESSDHESVREHRHPTLQEIAMAEDEDAMQLLEERRKESSSDHESVREHRHPTLQEIAMAEDEDAMQLLEERRKESVALQLEQQRDRAEEDKAMRELGDRHFASSPLSTAAGVQLLTATRGTDGMPSASGRVPSASSSASVLSSLHMTHHSPSLLVFGNTVEDEESEESSHVSSSIVESFPNRKEEVEEEKERERIRDMKVKKMYNEGMRGSMGPHATKGAVLVASPPAVRGKIRQTYSQIYQRRSQITSGKPDSSSTQKDQPLHAASSLKTLSRSSSHSHHPLVEQSVAIVSSPYPSQQSRRQLAHVRKALRESKGKGKQRIAGKGRSLLPGSVGGIKPSESLSAIGEASVNAPSGAVAPSIAALSTPTYTVLGTLSPASSHRFLHSAEAGCLTESHHDRAVRDGNRIKNVQKYMVDRGMEAIHLKEGKGDAVLGSVASLHDVSSTGADFGSNQEVVLSKYVQKEVQKQRQWGKRDVIAAELAESKKRMKMSGSSLWAAAPDTASSSLNSSPQEAPKRKTMGIESVNSGVLSPSALGSRISSLPDSTLSSTKKGESVGPSVVPINRQTGVHPNRHALAMMGDFSSRRYLTREEEYMRVLLSGGEGGLDGERRAGMRVFGEGTEKILYDMMMPEKKAADVSFGIGVCAGIEGAVSSSKGLMGGRDIERDAKVMLNGRDVNLSSSAFSMHKALPKNLHQAGLGAHPHGFPAFPSVYLKNSLASTGYPSTATPSHGSTFGSTLPSGPSMKPHPSDAFFDSVHNAMTDPLHRLSAVMTSHVMKSKPYHCHTLDTLEKCKRGAAKAFAVKRSSESTVEEGKEKQDGMGREEDTMKGFEPHIPKGLMSAGTSIGTGASSISSLKSSVHSSIPSVTSLSGSALFKSLKPMSWEDLGKQ